MNYREILPIGPIAACFALSFLMSGFVIFWTMNSCHFDRSVQMSLLFGGAQYSSFRWSLVCVTRNSLPHGGENEKSANAPVQPLERYPEVEP